MAVRWNPNRRWPFLINDETPGLPRSTFWLLVVSGLSALSVLFTPAGLVALLFAILAFVFWRGGRRAGARTLTRVGWIAYAVVTALQIAVTLADVRTG